jgi:uncharacterized membrane protein
MNLSTRLYLIAAIFTALWCAGILGAPLLKHAGEEKLAEVCYSFFSRVCHQDDARSFHLEGEKLGVCIRCSAVYFGFLIVVALLLALRLPRSSMVRRWIFISAISPMIMDIVLNDSGVRLSTTVSRVVTGGLFGAAMPWFVLPLFVEACVQIINRARIHPPLAGVLNYVRKAQ